MSFYPFYPMRGMKFSEEDITRARKLRKNITEAQYDRTGSSFEGLRMTRQTPESKSPHHPIRGMKAEEEYNSLFRKEGANREILHRLRLLKDDKLAFLVILSVSEESRGSLPPAARRI